MYNNNYTYIYMHDCYCPCTYSSHSVNAGGTNEWMSRLTYIKQSYICEVGHCNTYLQKVFQERRQFNAVIFKEDF